MSSPEKQATTKPAATAFEQIITDPILTLAFFEYCCGKYVAAGTYPEESKSLVLVLARKHLTTYRWTVPESDELQSKLVSSWVLALMAEQVTVLNMEPTDMNRFDSLGNVLKTIRAPMVADVDLYLGLANEFQDMLASKARFPDMFKMNGGDKTQLPIQALFHAIPVRSI